MTEKHCSTLSEEVLSDKQESLLLETVLRLRNTKEAQIFLQSILKDSEYDLIIKRWEIVTTHLLTPGITNREISRRCNASQNTVGTFINRIVKRKSSIARDLFDRLRQDKLL